MANIRDLAVGIVATAPSPATSGTTLVLDASQGLDMPAVPFKALLFPPGVAPTKHNSEKVLVTDVTGDTLTITRAQGETTAQSVAVGWGVSNAIFADDFADVAFSGDYADLTNGVDTSAFVPYTGAANTVDLNGNNLVGNELQGEILMAASADPEYAQLTGNKVVWGNGSGGLIELGSTTTDTLEIRKGSASSVLARLNVAPLSDIRVYDFPDTGGTLALHENIPAEVTTVIGTLSVDSLWDVDTTTTAPNDGEVMTYDISTGKWVPSAPAGGGEWGSITGTLSDQTDLQAALDAKADDTDLHTHSNQAVLDATTASFTTADETKLDGVESGAQVNTVTPTNTVTLTNKTLTTPTINTNATLTDSATGNTPVLTVQSSGAFAAAEPTIDFKNTAGNVTTARISSKPGTTYTNSDFRIQVADSSKALQERLKIDVSGVVTVPTAQGSSANVVATTSHTQTLTNKRITPRVGTVASGSTITPTGDSSDIYTVTALAANATIAAPSGTPTNGQVLALRIKDNGTARTLTWNSIYRGVGVTLPTTTTVSKTIYLEMVYNSTDTKWDVVDYRLEGVEPGTAISNVYKATPSGSVNGTNTAFTTSTAYLGGSLQVFVNGLSQSSTHITETSPSAGTFSLDTAPATGDIVQVAYQYTPSSGSGNADTVDGIHANTTATANQLVPLNASGVFDSSVLGGAWTSWTPTWSGLTIGNATVTARASRVGKTVVANMTVVFGTTSSVTSSYPTFTLPFTAATTGTGATAGTANYTYLDNGTAWFYGRTAVNSGATTGNLTVTNTAGTYATENGIAATIPMSWTTGDKIIATLVYEGS